jgi:hypothetical protein
MLGLLTSKSTREGKRTNRPVRGQSALRPARCRQGGGTPVDGSGHRQEEAAWLCRVASPAAARETPRIHGESRDGGRGRRRASERRDGVADTTREEKLLVSYPACFTCAGPARPTRPRCVLCPLWNISFPGTAFWAGEDWLGPLLHFLDKICKYTRALLQPNTNTYIIVIVL